MINSPNDKSFSQIMEWYLDKMLENYHLKDDWRNEILFNKEIVREATCIFEALKMFQSKILEEII